MAIKDLTLKKQLIIPKKFYREFTIRKRNENGVGSRTISEPLPSLREIQDWINLHILQNVKINRFAKAYIPKRSIVDNARFHKNQKKVISLDVENFFSSISIEGVTSIFKSFGYSGKVSSLLAKLCCLEDCLPQGASTSPTLSNIYMHPFDKKISDYCVKNDIRYTRYADDITFSGDFDETDLLSLVENGLNELHLKLNSKKTKIMTKNMRQIVTGIVVNDKLQIPRNKRRKIRQIMYEIRTKGLEKHMEETKQTKANYLKHLLGLVNHALFINPETPYFKEYKSELYNLLNSSQKDDSDDLPF